MGTRLKSIDIEDIIAARREGKSVAETAEDVGVSLDQVRKYSAHVADGSALDRLREEILFRLDAGDSATSIVANLTPRLTMFDHEMRRCRFVINVINARRFEQDAKRELASPSNAPTKTTRRTLTFEEVFALRDRARALDPTVDVYSICTPRDLRRLAKRLDAARKAQARATCTKRTPSYRRAERRAAREEMLTRLETWTGTLKDFAKAEGTTPQTVWNWRQKAAKGDTSPPHEP